jgi:hypothetical protein
LTQAKTFDTLLNTTSHTEFSRLPVYTIHTVWITIHFVAVVVMFCAAIFSLVVHSQCRAPSILGNISSLTRDSAYLANHGVSGNSAEDGASTTKRLQGTKVMTADVEGGHDVGKIAFVPLHEGGVTRVKKRRWYE